MKFEIPRQRRNGKLAQKQGSKRRRLKDKIYFPVAGRQSRLRDQWRVALKERGQLERAAQWEKHPDPEAAAYWPAPRLEENEAHAAFFHVPTIWAILERNNDLYRRPVWADKVFGAN